MGKKKFHVIPIAFEKQIKRKAWAMTYDFNLKVEAELLRAARIGLLEGRTVLEMQRIIEDY